MYSYIEYQRLFLKKKKKFFKSFALKGWGEGMYVSYLFITDIEKKKYILEKQRWCYSINF